ncbi:MAG: hypothetical protein QOJ65_110 [Fimbriimonadaceae bacterium]|jgi:hypothetical protein|nr:hypothetical protein [Fimbriimonadaceae bacterium]
MNSNERISAALAGKPVDRKPVIAWPGEDKGSDVHVLRVSVPRRETGGGGESTLMEVLNPFGLALSQGTNLLHVLRDNPARGESLLADAVRSVRARIRTGIAEANGILYRLHGARSSLSTPMEYGGHFLELDRDILSFAEGGIRMVFIVGGEDTYLDFVSDLPAEIFGWDVKGTGVSVSQMRSLRKGALAAASKEADILLSFPTDVSVAIESPLLTNA